MRGRKDDKEKNLQQKLARRDAFLKLGMVFLAVLLVADTIQIARFGEIVERVDSYNKGVVDELGGFREDIIMFGNDINEMRSFLFLPERNYSFMEDDTEIETEQNKEASNTEKALYQFMGSYIDEQSAAQKAERSQKLIREIMENTELESQLEPAGLSTGPLEEDDFSLQFKISNEDKSLYAIVADKKNGQIKIQSALGIYEIQSENEADLLKEIISYAIENAKKVQSIKERIEEQKDYLNQLRADEQVSGILNQKNLRLAETPKEDDTAIAYEILNSEDTAVATIKIIRESGKLAINDQSYEAREDLYNVFIKLLNELDGSTALEKLINDRRAELEEVITEEPFRELLRTQNLTIDSEPREEYNKLLYDVKNESGEVQFSFVIELSSGYFKVLKDNQEIDLYSALQDGSKKNS